MINPYQPPRNDSIPLAAVPFTMKPTTQVALVATSMALGVVYQLVQNLSIASSDHIPIWPHLTIPTLISLAVAIRSRSLIYPPLAAFGGIVAGLMVFAAFHSLRATDLEIALPIAILCSLPSLCIVLLRRTCFRAGANETGSIAEQWQAHEALDRPF